MDEWTEQDKAKLGVLALTGIVGGGVLGYVVVEAAQKPGGLLGTDEGKRPLDFADVLGFGIAGYLTYEGYKDLVPEVGWEPLVVGSALLVGVGLIARGGLRTRSRRA